jgi:hypothetical protein
MFDLSIDAGGRTRTMLSAVRLFALFMVTGRLKMPYAGWVAFATTLNFFG